MNNKRNELGQFLPNDQLERLVWVRADASEEMPIEEKQAPNELRESCAVEKHRPAQPAFDDVGAGSESNDLAQHNPPSQIVTLVNDAGEEVVLMGLPTKRAKRGQRSNRCSRCGCETDTSKRAYCKSCWAEYQRERYAAKGR